jgi:hypothetical protein
MARSASGSNNQAKLEGRSLIPVIDYFSGVSLMISSEFLLHLHLRLYRHENLPCMRVLMFSMRPLHGLAIFCWETTRPFPSSISRKEEVRIYLLSAKYNPVPLLNLTCVNHADKT